MTKYKLDIQETLRLAGVEDNEIPMWASILATSSNYNESCKSLSELSNMLMDAFNEIDIKQVFPIESIKKMNSIIDNILKPPVESENSSIASILNAQSEKKLPPTKFILEANKLLQYTTFGLSNGFYFISADPHVGKTGFLCQLSADILLSNSDSTVIFVTLDDTKKDMMKRIICSIAYRIIPDKSCHNLVPEISYVESGYSYMDENMKPVINKTCEEIKGKSTEIYRELMTKKRIVLHDGYHTMTMIDDIIMAEKKGKTILIIDAVYNMEGTWKNDFEQDSILSRYLKLLPVRNNVTVLVVKDVSKNQGKGKGTAVNVDGAKKDQTVDIEDTKGSTKWYYNCSVGATLYKKENKLCLNIQKNKISGRSLVRYYDQNPFKNIYRELNTIIKKEPVKN